MQFARGREGGFDQYAIKICFDRDDFERETALYMDSSVAPVLPELKFASENASCSFQHGGYVFPPFMVLLLTAAPTLPDARPCLSLFDARSWSQA